MSKWLLVGAFLFISLAISTGFFITGYYPKNIVHQIFNDQDALHLSAECGNGKSTHRAECLQTKIISHITRFPSETGNIFQIFWELEKKGKLTDDPRIFSDIVHEAGMSLIDSGLPLDKVLSFCGTTFKQGCIHGAVMEYIDTAYPSEMNPLILFDMCHTISQDHTIYINCLHGIGHELAAKSKAAIQDIVHMCDPLSYEDRFACASGVLMEYSTGTTGSDFHSHTPIGKKELPCSDIDDTYKAVCYAGAGSYRQYEPMQESFSKSYEFCFHVPKEYVQHCMIGLSERAFLAAAENQEK